MKTVILCGGEGIRLREYTESIPKPMVKIGDKPILWHIMKLYSYCGFDDFVLCLGYKGDKIKEYFKNDENWSITFADTGLGTNTGGRVKKIEKYIEDDTFFTTYGDGLSDIDLNDLLEYHKSKNKIATLTTIKPLSPFGMLEIDSNNLVTDFKEKPILDYWINGGFFVFDVGVFDYISENDALEKEVFERLAKDNNLSAYKHTGFWKCMDTYKDNLELNKMWVNKKAKWVIWE